MRSLLEKIVAAAQRLHAKEELFDLCSRRGDLIPQGARRDATVQTRVLLEALRDLQNTVHRPVVERKR